jgi:cobalt transporter subunit CbtA
MLTRLIAAALFAGLAAGLLVAGLQNYFVTPMILKAETFESHAPAAEGAAHTHAPGEAAHEHSHDAAPAVEGHSHDANEWQPADGFERFAYSALATVATAVGYGLVLVALMTVVGAAFTIESFFKWALGAFIATTLAPGFGLAPVLPGMGETALAPRQIWWIATALATGAGLYVVTHYSRNVLAIAGGIALLAIPHIWGAPPADLAATAVPARLAAQFAASTMTLSFILWAVLGLGLGMAFARLGNPAAREQTA